MNDIHDNDSWYKRCSECREWRITDMNHCWLCGEVLGPPCTLEDVIRSKRPAVIDVTRMSAVRRLYQKANELGYAHEEDPFFQFFEELNKRRK